MKRVIIILLCLLVTSCMTERKIKRFKRLYCKDSISVQIQKEIIKMPVHYTDSSTLEMLLRCDSLGNAYYTQWKEYEGRYTDLKASLKDNKLQVISIVKVHDTVWITYTDTVYMSHSVKEVERKLSEKESFLIVCGKILCWTVGIIIIIVIIYLVVRYFLK